MASRLKTAYFLIPLVVFAAQALMTFSSMSQLRGEEVTAAFREVLWFANHEVYEPGNSNVGWYGTLAIVYSIFGFDPYTAKIYRLILQFVSLFCLALLLRRWLGEKWATIPLLTIGLSPTLLFWNTLEAPYGIDLQYLPIVLFLLLSNLSYLRYLSWALAMIAWLSYPTFVFYLPALFLFHLGGVKAHRVTVRYPAHPRGVLALVGSLVAFLAPLVAVVFWLKGNPGRLFIAGSALLLDETSFFRSLVAPFTNLFGSATSYYLELKQTEMSLVFPALAFLFVIFTSFPVFKKARALRFPIILIVFVGISNIIITSLSLDGGLPGGRRNTPFLAAFYALFTVVWYWTNKSNWSNLTNWVIRGALALLLVHHVIVFPFNLAYLKTPSPFQANIWFEDDPRASVAEYVEVIQKKDLYFNCEESYPGNPECQYGPIFSAVKSSCLWGVPFVTPLSCHEMYGYFPVAGYQKLDIATINGWQENGFEH